MTPASKSRLTPSLVRLLLTLSLFLLAGAAVTGFVFANKQLKENATAVSRTKVDATGSKASLQTLQTIETELTQNQDIVEKAKIIKHTSELPQFRAIEDIRNHAKANNLTISAITFANTDASTTSTPATGAPAGATAPLATPTTAPASAGGIEITFTLGDSGGDGSVDALSFVNFLYDIEHSIPKMQVQGISVTGKGSTRIGVEPLKVKMFTK